MVVSSDVWIIVPQFIRSESHAFMCTVCDFTSWRTWSASLAQLKNLTSARQTGRSKKRDAGPESCLNTHTLATSEEIKLLLFKAASFCLFSFGDQT